jgi:hypothetical protein
MRWPALWVATLALASAAHAQKAPDSAALLKGIEARPWNDYYTLAAALFREGRNEEAARWFYIGQIRGQAQVRCFEDRQAATLRGSLNDVVGQDINIYLYGSTARAVRIIDEALAWDAANPNPHLPMPKCAEALEIARADKMEQREWTLANVEKIRANRAANGLPNEVDP